MEINPKQFNSNKFDGGTIKSILKNLWSIDKIVIFISHRFTTARQANKICVIEKGVMTENGTHEELLANQKTYANLFKMQARSYEE